MIVHLPFTLLNFEPTLDILRPDPRFKELLKRANLPVS
jgi:hypothetical protein